MKDMIGRSIRYVLTLAALGMAVLPQGSGTTMVVTKYQNLVAFLYVCLGWIVAIVVIAALMRKDLQRIEEQEKRFTDLRDEIKKDLSEVKMALDSLIRQRGNI